MSWIETFQEEEDMWEKCLMNGLGEELLDFIHVFKYFPFLFCVLFLNHVDKGFTDFLSG